MKKLIAMLMALCLMCCGAGYAAETDEVLIVTLEAIRDDYHPGTAGCSLTAARLAAEIMDWYMTVGSTNMAVITMANTDVTADDPDGIAFADKLTDIFESAIMLYGESGRMLLADAGYEPQAYPYNMNEIKEVFDGLFTGLGVDMPVYIRLYIPNDTAEYVIATPCRVEALSPEAIIAALIEYGVLVPEANMNGMESTPEMLTLDMNEAFRVQICSTGTAGELMLITALTESFMDNFGSQRILVTVDGSMFESGHVEYGVIHRNAGFEE